MRARVTVVARLRPGILDPQGKTVERNLPALGFEGVRDVRVGKSIEMVVEGTDTDEITAQVKSMCEAFLTNPVIEEYDISILPLDGEG